MFFFEKKNQKTFVVSVRGPWLRCLPSLQQSKVFLLT
jgi:hypothetical protein